MVFSSLDFIFWFLPLTLLAYFALLGPWLQREGRGMALSSTTGAWLGNACLLGASLIFYFWGEQKRIYILIVAIALNYMAGLVMGPITETGKAGRHRRRQWLLVLAVTINLGMLVYFKYLNFLVGTMGHLGIGLSWAHVVLPLGISFFIFQAMSYTIDVYRGDVPPARDLVAFACYITMFPQLVAGPIVRYVDVASQLRCRSVSAKKMASGIRRFVIGLAKKVLIANQMAILADQAFALSPDEVTFGAAWMGTLAYTLQIYFDFSGYSDMAIGLGRMFGFEFLENFNYPYIARSVQDFWRRWHISLSTWFRDYLYIPLGGNRGSVVGTCFNLLAVFALCGFWHGASLNFLLWGLYHGTFLMLERLFRGRFAAPRLLGHVYTLAVVMVGWVLFRAETWEMTLTFWKAMAGLGPKLQGGSEIWVWFGNDIRLATGFGILFSMPVVPRLLRGLSGGEFDGTEPILRSWPTVARLVMLLALFLACVPLLAAETYNPFIYFRF